MVDELDETNALFRKLTSKTSSVDARESACWPTIEQTHLNTTLSDRSQNRYYDHWSPGDANAMARDEDSLYSRISRFEYKGAVIRS